MAVVGGGISGLAGAHRLRGLLGPDARITLLDRADRLGGVLRTVELAGVAMDVGAEAFLARRPEVPALLAELGLTDQQVHPSASASATVRAAGRTGPLPSRTLLGVPGSDARLDGLLSPAGLARAGAEPTRPMAWSAGSDQALGGLLRERFGDELTDRLVGPLLGGVYAGRVDRLGLRATMPALAAALDDGAASLTAAADTLLRRTPPGPGGTPPSVFGALRGGYRALVEQLRRSCDAEVRLGLPVRGLLRTATGWRLEIGSAVPSGPVEPALDVDAVLLAVPAPALRRLLTEPAPAAAAAVAPVELASPVVVALAYRAQDAVGLPNSSGVLVAADEPLHVKAFTHSSRKWPHLAASATDGLLRLRASLGRAGEAGALRADDDELVARVRADLATLTGIAAAPVAVHVQRWGGGLPQYAVGHLDLVERLERAVGQLPGLEVAGALLCGVGVPACIGTGRAAAERIAAGLAAPVSAGDRSDRDVPDRCAPGNSGNMAV